MGAEHARDRGGGRVEIRALLMSRRQRCTYLHLLLLSGLMSGLMSNQRRRRDRRLRVRPPRVAADETGRAERQQAIRVRDDRDERL